MEGGIFVNLPNGQPLSVTSAEMDIMQSALESLYRDQIFPDEKTVKARLKTFNVGMMIEAHFVEIYKIQPAYLVAADANGTICIQFKNGYRGFEGWVDPCNNSNPYPHAMWQKFEEYLREMMDDIHTKQGLKTVTFHRGRYGMAQDLYGRRLPFFQGYSLGKVCHIVELAIQRDLLHYENNLLLPAQACGKYHNAIYGVPTASSANAKHQEQGYVKDMNELKAILSDLLRKYPDGFNLSTLKTKIKGWHGKRLSETVFHETKLLTLVQMPPLDNIVKIVKLQGNCGYLCQPATELMAQIVADRNNARKTQQQHYGQGHHLQADYYYGGGRAHQHNHSTRGSYSNAQQHYAPHQQYNYGGHGHPQYVVCGHQGGHGGYNRAHQRNNDYNKGGHNGGYNTHRNAPPTAAKKSHYQTPRRANPSTLGGATSSSPHRSPSQMLAPSNPPMLSLSMRQPATIPVNLSTTIGWDLSLLEGEISGHRLRCCLCHPPGRRSASCGQFGWGIGKS
ncbi:unnamed protein product [Amoebophrya sp. A25]|nr:unnamed protein product [Amoebophrya sp. A25]|eukprot:GSA25T00020727001.1